MAPPGQALTRKYVNALAKHIEADRSERHSAGVLPVLEEIDDLPLKLLSLGITVAAASTLGVNKDGKKTYTAIALWLGRHIYQQTEDVELALRLGAWGVRMLIKLPFFAYDADADAEGPVLMLKYSNRLLEWLDETRANSAAGRDLLPSPTQPEPWTKFRQGDLILVTGRYSETAVQQAIDANRMSVVLESINSLQKVPFTINEDALEIARQRAPEKLGKPKKTLTKRDKIIQEQQRDSARAKIRNYHHDMTMAEAIASWDVFYNPLKMDSRSRVYSVPHFSYLLSDHVRGVINFARPLPIGEDGMFWLKAGVAGLASKLDPSVKAMTFKVRAAWTERNIDMVRAIGHASRQGSVPDQIMQIKKPIRLVAACIELDKALDEGLGYMTRLPVSFDCSCSALQHYAAITRAAEGKLANLGKGHTMADPYILVAGDVYPDNRDLMQGPDDREMVKEAAVGFFYGSKSGGWKKYKSGKVGPLYGMTEAIVDLLRDRGHTSGVGAQKLARDIYNAFLARVPAAEETLDFLVQLSTLMAKEDLPLSWATPFIPIEKKITEWIDIPGFTSAAAFHRRRRDVKLTLGDKKQIDTKGAANSIGANYVHSYDASLLHMIARAAGKNDIDLVTAHDCFAVHAPNAAMLYHIARQAFVALHAYSCEFREILAATKAALPTGTVLPKPPTKPPPDGARDTLIGEIDLLDFLTNDFAIN
jgi:DNA-directed RNA polymerase